MSPELVEVIRAHIDRLRRYGRSTTPEDYVFQSNKGRRMSRQSVGKILTEAALAASKTLCKYDLPALPHTTPHSMRRTYITIALLANNYDIKWVMDQVGHADSRMTLEVYAQLQQRARRENGVKFDALVRNAREQATRPKTSPQQSIGSTIGSVAPNTHPRASLKRHRRINQKARISRESVRLRNTDFELGTPRFSVTLKRSPDRGEHPANRWFSARANCAWIPVVWGGSGQVKDVKYAPRPLRFGCCELKGLECLSGCPAVRRERPRDHGDRRGRVRGQLFA